VKTLLASGPATYGVIACALAILTAVYFLLAPGRVRLAAERRRPAVAPTGSALVQATGKATTLIDTLLRRRGNTDVQIAVLERAGVAMRLQDFVLLVMAAALVAAAAGVLLVGPLLGLVLAIAVPLFVRLGLGLKAGRRRAAFADQLDDSLQLIASSLRAGHSLLQALASVAREAEEPTSVEFARVINETRVGRQVSLALDETAARMQSEDFTWATQAIAINREVGGNLAEVLDGVGNTSRERNQIRRQVKALSAEGKLSAYVLMALPFGIAGFLMFSNPGYMTKFTSSLFGYGLIGACVVLLVIGALWLRKVVSFKF
jgi:tight adherence protein B